MLIDAAHALGQLDVNLAQLDADYYVSNCHKWLAGPRCVPSYLWYNRTVCNIPYVTYLPGGCRKHNFWTARVDLIRNYIFGVLTSRAINWYVYDI